MGFWNRRVTKINNGDVGRSWRAVIRGTVPVSIFRSLPSFYSHSSSCFSFPYGICINLHSYPTLTLFFTFGIGPLSIICYTLRESSVPKSASHCSENLTVAKAHLGASAHSLFLYLVPPGLDKLTQNSFKSLQDSLRLDEVRDRKRGANSFQPVLDSPYT